MSRDVNRLSPALLLVAGLRLLRDDFLRLVGVAALLPLGLAVLVGLTVLVDVYHPGVPIPGRPGGLLMGALEVAGTLNIALPFVPAQPSFVAVFGLYDVAVALVREPVASLSWELLRVLMGILLSSVQLFATPLVWAAVIAIAGDAVPGRRTSGWQALRTAWSIMLPLVGTSMLICAGLALFAVVVSALSLWHPSLQLAVASVLAICGALAALPFVIVLPVMVFERRFGSESFRTSYGAMHGKILRGGGAMITIALVGQVLKETVGLAVNLGSFGSLIVPMIGSTVCIAYTSSVLVVLYRNVRGNMETTGRNVAALMG